MAFRGKADDHDHEQQILHVLLEGMRGIMMAQGQKVKPIPAPQPTITPVVEVSDEVPLVDDLLLALGTPGTVIR